MAFVSVATMHGSPAGSAAKKCPLASNGMKEVVARGYRGIILDQFGVLHDGTYAYPGAAEALRCLRAANCEIVILSNSSRRSEHAAAKLRAMFPETPLDVITSGELAREILRSSASPVRDARNVLHTNWAGRGMLCAADNGLSINTRCDANGSVDVSHVDAIVAHGAESVSVVESPGDAESDGDGGGSVLPCTWEELVRLVSEVARARPDAPFVCVNPDLVTVDGGVGLRPMPGALAAAFEEAGGKHVLRVGKPGSPAYKAALSSLEKKGIRREEVVCVGDSTAHDIAGAQSQGLASVYIAGGIDAERYGLAASARATTRGPWQFSSGAWDELVAGASPPLTYPTFAMPYFKW